MFHRSFQLICDVMFLVFSGLKNLLICYDVDLNCDCSSFTHFTKEQKYILLSDDNKRLYVFCYVLRNELGTI